MEITFKVIGGISLYSGRTKAIETIKEGKKVFIKLCAEKGDIVVSCEREQIGILSKDDENFNILSTALKEGKELKGVLSSRIGTTLVGTIEITKKEIENSLDLSEIILKVIKEGILSQEEIDERLTYCKDKLTERQLAKIFSTIKKYPDDIAKRIPRKPKTLYIDSTGILKRTVGYILSKRNLMLEGDRGVGKNVLAETIAWLFARPLYEASMNSSQDNNSLLGGKTFVDNSDDSEKEQLDLFENITELFKDGIKGLFSRKSNKVALTFASVIKKIANYFSGGKKLKFDPDIIVQAAEHGGIIVLDEFNTVVGHIMSVFNSLLDDRRRIQVPGYKLVEADDNFFAIATQNRDYQATFENNEATEDRFVLITFPTLDSIVSILNTKIKDLNYDTLNKCDMLFKAISKNVREGKLPERAMTIRGFVDACLASQNDVDLKDALIDCVANKAQEKVYRDSIETLISNMF